MTCIVPRLTLNPMKIPFLPLLLALALASPGFAQTLVLQPLTSFGTNGDGSLRPGDVPFLTSDGSRYQRGMAYNPTTGHLIIVNRFPLGAESIVIIDALTGTNVGTLDLCCPALGGSANFVYSLVGIADDGAIYVGNLTTSSTLVTFNLYRWASETNSQTLVYSGDPRNGSPAANSTRWGDTLAIRGAGTNTQVLLGTQSGTLAAILRPTDDTMATFTATTLQTDVPAGGIGYGLTFGAGNTFWGKDATAEGRPLYRLSFDLNAGTATTLQAYPVHTFPGRIGPITVLVNSNLLGAIEMLTETDRVRLYDISTLTNPPVLLDREEYYTNAPNNIFSGSVAFGDGRLYALNSENGILAFNLVSGSAALAPGIFSHPQSKVAQISSNVVFTVGADGTLPLSYQWRYDSTPITDATNFSYTLSNVDATNAGNFDVVVTNVHGAVTSSVAVLTVLPTFGNLLVYDPFAYTPGTLLSGQGGWILVSAAANGAMEAGNLDVPGLAPSYGNRYTWTNNSSVRLPIGTYTNGSVYFSFALRIDNPSTSTGNETLAGLSLGTTTAFSPKVNVIGNGSGAYQIGLYKGGGTTVGGIATNVFTAADTVFVVARYTFNTNSSTDDLCDLWVNPDPATFGAASAPVPSVAGVGASPTANDMTQVDHFFWRFASGYPKRTSDELRVGFSWAEVTPPSPPKLTATRSGNNIVISWSTNNSAGYTLQSNPQVDDSGGWEPVGTPVVVQGDQNTVTVAANTSRRFFRLKK